MSTPRIIVRCLATAEADLDGDLALLDEHERAAAQRLRFAEDRADYIAAHGLRRRLLAEVLRRPAHSLRFVQDKARGKPRLHDISRESVDLNLTHARGLSACVVGLSCMVGIDAEATQRHIDDEVLSLYAAPQELAPPASLASGEARLSLWTLKEALVKAMGEGLDIDLRRLHVSLDPPRLLAAPADMGPAHEWHLVHWREGSHHMASIAYRCARPVHIAGIAKA